MELSIRYTGGSLSVNQRTIVTSLSVGSLQTLFLSGYPDNYSCRILKNNVYRRNNLCICSVPVCEWCASFLGTSYSNEILGRSVYLMRVAWQDASAKLRPARPRWC